MKIINAWIDDPTLVGRFDPPKLCVEVTEEPSVTIEPEEFAGGWIVGKYGPFVNYTHPDQPTASDFNIRFRTRFPVVVDITLLTPNNEIDGFSLPLTRARQLVRKYANAWKLAVSDRTAESGGLLWVPTLIHPTCRHYESQSRLRDAVCHKTPARFVRIGGAEVPLCGEHIEIHNRKQAERRTARSS